jgi:outer membrane receptor for ferrienterochelin and colicins
VNANYATMFFPKFGYVGVDASIFYTYFSNKIIADYFTQPDAILYDNLRGYGVSRGITLNLDGSTTSGITFNTGITLLDVFSRQRDSAGALHRVPQLHASPFSATWNISYTFSRLKLRFDYTGNVYSPMFLPVLPNDFRPEKSPWFSLQNVQLSRKWGNWELYGGIKNLLNFLPQNPLMRPFDPFDKQITQNNPNNYTFDTAYGYAPLQGIRSFIGFRWVWQ